MPGDQLPGWGVRVESHYHHPGFRTEIHSHLHPSLIYVVSGQGECRRGGETCALAENTAVILEADEPHQLIDRPRAAMVVFVVYFSREEAGRNEEVVTPLFAEKSALAIPAPYARRIRGLLRQMLYEQARRPPHFRVALQNDLAAVLVQLRRASLAADQGGYASLMSTERVRSVLDFVAAHHYDHHGLAQSARMAGLSQRQFSNLCRRLTGRSYVQFVNEVRARRAHSLLRDSQMPVSAIAFEVGFEELSTFYRAFRKVYGRAPLAIREEPGAG